MNVKVLVTGATGFVGKRVCEVLIAHHIGVIAAARRPLPDHVAVGELNGSTDWRRALQGCSAVIHLAARVHVMADTERDPIKAYREVNVEGTLNLARQAVEAGVKRFVYVSSIKVNGESSGKQPFTSTDVPAPVDPYGQSKMEAELALRSLSEMSGMEVVIVRPPLVYGPGVKANFQNLIKLVNKGLPLPLGAARGPRSMVALDNLVDLLMRCLTHPNAIGQTFLVSDGKDMTVRELAVSIATALNKKVRLLPVPSWMVYGAARIAGKSAVADRLFGSLQVDITNTRERLGWNPPIAPDVAVKKTVEDFLKSKNRISQ